MDEQTTPATPAIPPPLSEKEVLGIRRLRDFLDAALAAHAAAAGRQIFLIHAPQNEPPRLITCETREALADAVRGALGDGYAWAFFGEVWPIRIFPYPHIVSSSGAIPVEPVAAIEVPDGALGLRKDKPAVSTPASGSESPTSSVPIEHVADPESPTTPADEDET